MKKGVAIYSLTALIIIIPSLFFMVSYVGQHHESRFSIDAVVSDQVHQMQTNLENDFKRAAAISGKRALLAMSEKVITTGSPLDDARAVFRELVLNNSIEGEESIVMEGNSLTDWLSAVSSIESGFVVEIELGDVSVMNKDGFNLLMTAFINISVTDRTNISSIERHLEKNITVSIEGLEDPLFPLKTGGIVKRTIEKYTYSYYTLKMAGNSSEGNCSGTVTFNPDASDKESKILVVESVNASDYSAFSGVVAEDNINLGNPPYNAGCYVSGVSNPTQQTTENQTVFIDEPRSSAWLLPINEAIPGGLYYAGDGPNFLQRLEGEMSPSDEGQGIETFLLPFEETEARPEQSRLEYHYLSEQSHQACWKSRWMESWFRLKAEDMADYGLADLSYQVC